MQQIISHNSLVSLSVATPLVIASSNVTNIIAGHIAYNTKCITKICIARHIFEKISRCIMRMFTLIIMYNEFSIFIIWHSYVAV